ncbi:dephospho-CoA kinase [Halonatronum saccharophilum]|uniref:dephospho-CoA kinase n=1 Tax=Halonatronum saccharophilum TaxID=150060 RepID=UPI000484E824|nr:dephospho-CoA kinase [Halonatronum saccharophilum]
MRIGLTGGIATGKSSVADILKDLGAYVVDADKLAHRLMSKGQILWEKVVKEFGQGVLDSKGEIDRGTLGEVIFSDPKKKEVLDNLVHPVIVEAIKSKVKKIEGESKLVVAEVPLLFEVGMQDFFDEILVVWVEEQIQLMRLMKRNSLTYDEAKKRIGSQMNLEDKVKKADYIIENNGDYKDLKNKIFEFWDIIVKKS